MDTLFGLGIVALLWTVAGFAPHFEFLSLGLVLLLAWGSELAWIGLRRRTLAMRLMDIHFRDQPSPSLRDRFVHLLLRDPARLLREKGSIGLALSLLYGPTLAFWLNHPMLLRGEKISVGVFIPDRPADWNELAFFYGLGLFPRTFEGHSVLFTLPYAKGPPARFVEKIQLRLRVPDITLTLEGPKTPDHAESPESVRDCVTSLWNCWNVREQLLWRHAQEMRASVGPSQFSLQWFDIGARTRGIRIVARGLRSSEERYLLFNSLGTPQALILARPNSDSGDAASQLIEQVVRSAQIYDTLEPGRARANVRLTETSLDRAQKAKDPVLLTHALADAQSALISKISVDPKEVQPYYHLGGVALMLAKHANHLRSSPLQVLDLDSWLTTAKILAKSAYLYAQDVSPADPDTKRLHDIWLEAKNL